MKLLIIIPAHNEVESLPGVIEGLRATCPQYDYLVVNDGSTDGTAKLCRENGYNLLDLPVNLGLDGAFQAGMMYAARHGYEAAIQFDADGQHLPQYVKPLADKLCEGYDIVIGSRFVSVKKPITPRMAGSFLISFAMRFVSGHKICDPTSGMRVFSRPIIERFAADANYTPEPDTISFLLQCGARLSEVQVEIAPRTAGSSYFTLMRSIVYMIQMVVSILLIQRFRKNDIQEGAFNDV